jgi:hypothetical protein
MPFVSDCMRSKFASLLLATVLGGGVLAMVRDAQACSCIDLSWEPRTAIPDYDVVFRGTVTHLEVPQVLRPELRHIEPPRVAPVLAVWGRPTVKAVLEVEEAWRGVVTREIELDVGSGWCCDCSFGAGFPGPGEELIVFASERDGTLHVSTCDKPIPIADPIASPSLEAFGPGLTMLMPGRTGAQHEKPDYLAFSRAIIIVFGLALALVAFVIARRARATDVGR